MKNTHNLPEHSQAKVQLLGEYIKGYLAVITNTYVTNIKIYDLFCGEGIYDNNGEGSPIILLKAVKEVYNSLVNDNKIPPKMDCFFNDTNEQKIEKLKNYIDQENLYDEQFGILTFSSQTYDNCLGRLLELVENAKNDEKIFVFIDPYEYKHIKAEHIKKLIKNKKTEVLLWLPTQFMYRFEKKSTPPVLYDFFEEINMQISENEFGESNIWKFLKNLKNAFQNFLTDDFFVDNFSIKKAQNSIFCLYFFTPHIRGFEKMMDAKWKIDQENGRGWEYKSQQSLFFEHKTNELEIKLKNFLKSKTCFNGDIYEFTLREGYLPTHTTEIFEKLQENGILDVIITSTNKKARKKSFYVNYENYKVKNHITNRQKVFFNLKE